MKDRSLTAETSTTTTKTQHRASYSLKSNSLPPKGFDATSSVPLPKLTPLSQESIKATSIILPLRSTLLPRDRIKATSITLLLKVPTLPKDSITVISIILLLRSTSVPHKASTKTGSFCPFNPSHYHKPASRKHRHINIQAEYMASSSIPNHPFPFLQLPPEVRNIIYRFALPSEPVLPRGPKSTSVWRDDSGQWRRSTPRIQPQHPSLNIFLVCRQLHQEASYIFYHHAHFVIKLQRTWSPRHITGTQFQNPRFESNDIWKNQYARVRNIDLELSWDLSRPVSKCLHLYRVSRILENFRNLRTVTVRFKPFLQRKGGEVVDSISWEPPNKSDCEQLLRSLVWLPKKYPNLCIEIETLRLETVESTWCSLTVYKVEEYSLTMYKLEEYMAELRAVTRRPAGRERHHSLANFIG